MSMRSSPSSCFERRVRADGEGPVIVGSDRDGGVLVGLDDVLLLALERGQGPLVHGAVQAPVDNRRLSSAEKAMPVTLPPWPRQLPTFSHVYMLYTWITGPFTAAKYLPPLLKEHSRQPLMLNSRWPDVVHEQVADRSLSLNPTRTCSPLGWNATPPPRSTCKSRQPCPCNSTRARTYRSSTSSSGLRTHRSTPVACVWCPA